MGSGECLCISVLVRVCVYHLGLRNKKRSTAQANNPRYHDQEPIVLYDDKVLLYFPQLIEFVQTVSYGPTYILRPAIHKYAIVCNPL